MKQALTPLEGQEGFAVPRYSRGKKTTERLLEAGRRLLRDRTLDQVPIQDICAHAGVTTGAFYSRFDGKESYFRALQTLLVAQLREGMAQRVALFDAGQMTLREVVESLARNNRMWAYRNEGVLRASLIERAVTGEDPLKRMNQDYVELVVPRLARLHPAGASPELETRIRFAYQAMVGTLIYTLVNRSGTYRLSDRTLETEMARAFFLYITQELGQENSHE
ncbi:TetR/AcrR family transcriptional regulator [Cupriavidus sp. WKF15]|uniref:TetR/AcrR family transcriptional regulator n=1 Tax=Cupriavidus sp. WKF15 TaxID=3032282 RepID=UPI0023E12B43|nr:TetR/AcrR family transcriptional regulator [Cupriavidus sp. WKF15]WER50025.1 TetR/AcrR family transcriptional regulator [Cupriavidus sp. WKF15]